MSKRLFCLLLTVMLIVLSLPSLAEDFTLRNGIQFGETMEQVKAKETLGVNANNADETHFETQKGTVAGFDDVSIIYTFDEDNQLNEVIWCLSITTSKDTTDIEYEKLENALKNKYGTPLGYSGGDCYIITGKALTGAISFIGLYKLLDGVGDYCKYAEWDYEYTEGNHVKIEIIQYYFGENYSKRNYQVRVGYKYFSDEDLAEAMQEKQEDNEKIMNDI